MFCSLVPTVPIAFAFSFTRTRMRQESKGPSSAAPWFLLAGLIRSLGRLPYRPILARSAGTPTPGRPFRAILPCAAIAFCPWRSADSRLQTQLRSSLGITPLGDLSPAGGQDKEAHTGRPPCDSPPCWPGGGWRRTSRQSGWGSLNFISNALINNNLISWCSCSMLLLPLGKSPPSCGIEISDVLSPPDREWG